MISPSRLGCQRSFRGQFRPQRMAIRQCSRCSRNRPTYRERCRRCMRLNLRPLLFELCN